MNQTYYINNMDEADIPLVHKQAKLFSNGIKKLCMEQMSQYNPCLFQCYTLLLYLPDDLRI